MNTLRGRGTRLVALLTLPLVLSACALFDTPTPFVFPSATPTTEAAVATDTPQPSPPTDTPEAEPAPTDTQAPPTDTPKPKDTPVVGPPPDPVDMGRLSFAPGTTEAAVSGELLQHESHAYTMGVGAGQVLEVSTVSAGELEMLIVGADGGALRIWDDPFHRGIVDATQDYIVTIRAKEDTSYGMTVIIPQRVVFETGATTAQVEVEIPANYAHHLTIRALEGQTMTIDTTTTSGEILTVVYGFDGMVLQTDHGGATDFSGTLPSTQDYFIGIRALYGNPATLTVDITIPPP